MTPGEELITRLYDAFSRGDMPAFLDMCADDAVFEVPGSTPFSGTHSKATFATWIGTVMQICEGNFRETIYEAIANDEHGVAILDHFTTIKGVDYTYRTDHIWDFRDGKVVRFRERPGNQAEFDRIWGQS